MLYERRLFHFQPKHEKGDNANVDITVVRPMFQYQGKSYPKGTVLPADVAAAVAKIPSLMRFCTQHASVSGSAVQTATSTSTSPLVAAPNAR
jgi:hypothetical protein